MLLDPVQVPQVEEESLGSSQKLSRLKKRERAEIKIVIRRTQLRSQFREEPHFPRSVCFAALSPALAFVDMFLRDWGR